MKVKLFSVYFLVSVLFYVEQIAGQEILQRDCVEPDGAPNVQEYAQEGWLKVDHRLYSMYIPKGFVQKQTKPIDGAGASYESDGEFIGVDISDGVRPLTFEKRKRNYVEKFVCVGNRLATISHFEHDGTYRSVSILLFQFDSDRNMAVSFLSNTAGNKETADKIFRSLRLKQ